MYHRDITRAQLSSSELTMGTAAGGTHRGWRRDSISGFRKRPKIKYSKKMYFQKSEGASSSVKIPAAG